MPAPAALAGWADIAVRQTGPDLTVTKTNDVSGSTSVGTAWTWTATIDNVGTLAANFTPGQIVLADNLPNGSTIAYGAPLVTPSGGATGLTCSVDFTTRLTCVAGAGGVTMPPGSAFRVALSAQASAPGAYTNPRAGTTCGADPNNNVAETNEGNNACADTVNVLGPDLTVSKSNNVGGSVPVGAPWTWTVTITNSGATAASFSSGQIVLADNLPNANVTYSTTVVTPAGGATGLDCSIDFTFRLTCVANAGGVTMPPGSSFRVAFNAQASAPGAYANPRAGSTCLVDPNGTLAENDENNNACTDTVTVLAPDLTISKANNVGGGATIGVPWTWTVTVANVGTSAATFTDTQAIFFDHLPTTNVTYGTVTVTPIGGTTGPINCAVDFTLRLACFATGGTVTIPSAASFTVALPATASAPGIFANPRAGLTCVVNPNNVLVEASTSNNSCSDTVRAGPDLTATLTNNVSGAGQVSTPWVWTATVASTGTTAATFSAGQAVLFDLLPTANVTYGTPVMTAAGGASGALDCKIDFTVRLSCFAVGAVSLPPGSSYQVAFTALPSATGAFTSPRNGVTCLADPNNVIAEASETNNGCADTITVGTQSGPPAPPGPPSAPGPGSPSAPVADGGAAIVDDNDDDSSNRKPTERQRFERSHTSAAGEDDYRTEGDVLEVRCDASSAPRLDVTYPTHTPYLVIATRDGNQQLRLLYDTKSQCSSIQVGDYAEADGEKQTELLFDVHNVTIKHRR